MDQLRTSGRLCLLVIGLVATIPAAARAAPQGQQACGKIRAACQEAGFIRGFAAEGVGLQIHCVMPIMQGRPQPLTARRPLPKVDPQLVADCRARNPRFGQGPLPPSAALAQPTPASSRASILNDLGQTLYRIHGTNQPSTIGQFVSSGCIRLTNDDIVDLSGRVNIGTRVVVLPGTQPGSIHPTANSQPLEPAPRPRPKAASAEKPAATSAAGAPSRLSPLSAAPVQAPATKGEAPNRDTTSAPAAPTAAATPPVEEMAE